jgi:glycosyltransferase involved in cell wall biosynthesis
VLRDIPVFEEFYTDGEDCLMCESFEEFREAVDRLAADPGLRERLGEEARATAREHGLDRVAVELRDAYDEATRLADVNRATTD